MSEPRRPRGFLAEAHAYGGVTAAACGAGMFHPGAGLIVAGLGLFSLFLIALRRAGAQGGRVEGR